MTSLLDMVKEADMRLGFTDALKSPTAYETLDRAILRPRLLFCLQRRSATGPAMFNFARYKTLRFPISTLR